MPLVNLKKINESIAVITLQRPEKRNALSIPLIEEFLERLIDIKSDPKIRVLILQGAGKVFCAGLDLDEMQDKTKTEKSTALIKALFLSLSEFSCVTIAAIQGGAIAGGAGLALCCDFILSTPDALFGFPEVKRGLVPAFVTALLRQQVNEHQAKEWFLTGDVSPAQKGFDQGWIHRLVASDVLFKESLALAHKILEGGPEAIRQTKKLLQKLSPYPLSQNFDIAEEIHMHARFSEEAQEGTRAFLEKRNPHWISTNEKENS